MKKGVAYGFFNCRASQQEIEAELPTIRDLAQTPNQLELTLTEGLDNLPVQGDSALKTLVDQAKGEGIRYVMQAQLPGATNRQTADELATIVNQTYQSPLYQAGEAFSGAIVYHDGNAYQFRE